MSEEITVDGEEPAEPDGLEDTDEEDVEVDEDAPSTSEKKKTVKKNRRGVKKHNKKKDHPDPYTSSSAEMCNALGLVDVHIDYEQQQFQGITNLKSFSNLVRPEILKHNPGTIVAKMYPLFQVKYKEFQDHMTAQGKTIQKQPRYRLHPIQLPPPVPVKTRSSSRKSRRPEDLDGEAQDSDQEFETLIKDHEKQQGELEREREEHRANRANAKADKRKMALETVRASKKARRERGEQEEEHQNYCQVCNQGGELLLCDTCTRACHMVCYDESMVTPPEGDWSCPHCEEHGPDVIVKEIKKNLDYCRTCRETKNLLLCGTCTSSFHAYCLDPPLTDVPEGVWSCPRCMLPDPAQRVEKILSWRWKEITYPEPLAAGEEPTKAAALLKPPHKMKPRREREFFVKWKYLAYWQCEWLSETMMDVYFSALVRMYWRKVDPNNPPICEESTLSRHHSDQDPYKLRERFYQYGVKPEWMQIHRIIGHLSYAKSQQDYLVKWRELSYEQATWERDDTDIANYEDAIVKYWKHRERMLNDEIPRNVQKMMAKHCEQRGEPSNEEDPEQNNYDEEIDISKKYEKQPDFITETGGVLHPYQLEGVNWLRHSWSNGTDVILADEMGLGKTVQSLTFLYTLMKENHSKGPFLIAAPLSTIINWEREAEQWCPDFYVVTYVGDRESRMVIREHEFSFMDGAVRGGPKPSKIKNQDNMKFHVLLTSYECINMDKAILSSINWAALVVDEAHRLKNNQSTFFKNLRDYNIQYRVLLTGTPLQNNLEELFHLLNFLSPSRFNQLEAFQAEFSEISKEDQIGKLHNLLGPHMLRRLKADVLTGMPPKSELIVRVELSAMQKEFYKHILTRNFDALNVKNGGTQMSLINIIMELKKCCNHPYLFLKASLEAPKLDNGVYEITGLVKHSGKLLLLQKMMRKLKKGGHRVLVFSQMTMMLDILEDFCYNEGYRYERIDGSITGQQRQNAIDRFNAPGAQHFCFLLSTRAGGLGINLATADTVIIYDSDWNPHNDIQAFSRAHRLGQKHKVMIYRFVTKGSVEERITSVAKKKMLLTHLVVRAGLGGKEGKSMSKTELDDVLRWGTEELFKPEEQIGESVDGDGKANEQEIVWNDAAIDYLLDRERDDEQPVEGDKKEHWTNEYLSSFKVATYVTKVAGEDEEEEEVETEVIKESDTKEQDPEYWEKLLKHHYEHDQETEAQKLGKGKRVRKKVNYASENKEQGTSAQKNGAQEVEELSSNESETREEVHSDDDYDEKKKRRRDDGEKLPPLMAKVNGQIEILGFTPRQRKTFYNAIMRWGVPPQDTANTQWALRDLRGKPERIFRAYTSLFMRHLCEPGSDNNETFSDGVPREGMNRIQVLSRVGLLSLIHRKVQEFERYNGDWSMPEMQNLTAQAPTICRADEPASSGDLSAALSTLLKEEPMDFLFKLDDTCDDNLESEPPKLQAEKPKSARPHFKFNICEGAFTELHTLWDKEERVAKHGKEFEVWNRRHDFWLLAFVAAHGYGRYQINFHEINSDPKFTILNEPFKLDPSSPAGPNIELRNRFLQRRFKLLEQALVVEEQLRRAAHLRNQGAPGENDGGLAQRLADLEHTADSHAEIAKESRSGDRNANVVLHNVLNTLDNMLDDMKSDVSRLPATVGQNRPVTERLQMTERKILSRLTNKGAAAKTSKPVLPPSGPFVTPMVGQKFSGIQPKFAAQFTKSMIVNKPSNRERNTSTARSPNKPSHFNRPGPSSQPAPSNLPKPFYIQKEPLQTDERHTPSCSFHPPPRRYSQEE